MAQIVHISVEIVAFGSDYAHFSRIVAIVSKWSFSFPYPEVSTFFSVKFISRYQLNTSVQREDQTQKLVFNK